MIKVKKLDRLVNLILVTRRLIADQVHLTDRIDPMSIVRLETLRLVNQYPGLPMNKLADYLGIAPSSATSMANILVRSGYLRRSFDPSDRRVVRLVITKSGQKSFKTGRRKIEKLIRHALKSLKKTEILDLVKIFEKLVQSLEKKQA